MKLLLCILSMSILFIGCSQQPKIISQNLPKTYLLKSSFSELPNWEKENYTEVLVAFVNSCQTKKTKKLYSKLCAEAELSTNPKNFLEKKFTPYEIYTQDGENEGLLTGYYEPQLFGSLTKSERYKYPVYETPTDLISVDLSSIYPELKKFRLRGKLEGNKLIPYYPRAESNGENSKVICYVDSKIDLFFLEIQGSGRVKLDTDEVLFIGYDNQNGHKYRAIGRYLVEEGALSSEEVSLQSIRKWLYENPSRVEEVLNYNESVVYFKQRDNAATGALGLELKPNRSIAVDRSYIPLGSMVYFNAIIDKVDNARVVMAQDTGGAIKGAVRADMFLGYGDDAMNTAGRLKSPLKLWVILPKKENI